MQAVVGGLYEALYSQILDGDVQSLPDLVPDLIYCALVPYLGHRRAIASSIIERERRARFTVEEPGAKDPADAKQAILEAD